MTVELSPITDADIAAVAGFLHVNYKNRIPWARSRLAGPWKVDAPNHGFVLRDGQRIVGAFLAFYSERLIAGRAERFCDLGTWYVLPEFRFRRTVTTSPPLRPATRSCRSRAGSDSAPSTRPRPSFPTCRG